MKEKQECFYNPDDSFLRHIHKLQITMNQFINKIIIQEKIDIKAEQLPVLMATFLLGPISQIEISQSIERDKSSVQRSILSLSNKGYLKVKEDKTDSRKKLIITTAKGNKTAKRLSEIVMELEKKIEKILGNQKTFHKQLIKINSAMDDLLKI